MTRREARTDDDGRPRDLGELYAVGDLARDLGITPRAIRFYESKGLLSPRRAGGARVYTRRDRARLQIILRGKRLGFSVAGIKEFLDLYDADPRHEEQLRLLLRGVRERLAELEGQRRDLELTLDELREIEQQTLDALEERAAAAEPASASADHHR